MDTVLGQQMQVLMGHRDLALVVQVYSTLVSWYKHVAVVEIVRDVCLVQ
jgi:hypothetical protein